VRRKIIPATTSKVVGGKFYRNVPIREYRIFPPGRHSGPLVADCWAVELVTEVGSRWHGFAAAAIGPDLRVHVTLSEGQERDEVIARWEDSGWSVPEVSP
jgi:hypothetical protein